MKRFGKETTKEKIEAELKQVAKELKLDFNDPLVLLRWQNDGGIYSDQVFVDLIAPTYFPDREILFDSKLGHYLQAYDTLHERPIFKNK